MQRLLEAPKANMTTFTDQEQPQSNAAQVQPEPGTDDTKYDGLTTAENKRIPIPEHVEPEPEKEASGAVFPAL
jgi:hypothetical protein